MPDHIGKFYLDFFLELGTVCCEATETFVSSQQKTAVKAICGFVTTFGIAVVSVFLLVGEWTVWTHFNRDGFSDNPLIPPTVPWMDIWLALIRSLSYHRCICEVDNWNRGIFQ